MNQHPQGKQAPPPRTPVATPADARKLAEELLDVMNKLLAVIEQETALVRAGKVREVGCSNVSAYQLHSAEAAARPGMARFASVQNHYNLLHRDPEAEVLPECARQGLAFLPYFPLANGLLSGKYRRGEALPLGSRIES